MNLHTRYFARETEKKEFTAKGQMVYTIRDKIFSFTCRFQFRVINETGLATEWQRMEEGENR